jgi:cytoskeletal protein CcmA (bactofilin family)
MKFENILNAAARKESFCIPKEMIVNGSLTSETSGQITGIVKGDVWVKNRLIIHKEGVVNGDVTAEELVVYGRIDGDIIKCCKTTVHSFAVIKGNIATSEIHIEKDAVIEGLISKSEILPVSFQKKIEFPKKKNESADKKSGTIAAVENGTIEQRTWF